MKRIGIVAFGTLLSGMLVGLSSVPGPTTSRTAVHALAAGPTFTVNTYVDVADANPGDGKCDSAPPNLVCTLRAAIMEANKTKGATIKLPDDVYHLTLVGAGEENAVTGDLDIKSDLTIIGTGANPPIIDGNSGVTGDRVFHVGSGNVLISDVTVQHGRGAGGGIFIEAGSIVTLNDSRVSFNDGFDGAGIYNKGTLTLNNSIVSYNNTRTGINEIPAGGGIANAGN